jgi:hypothetical protein
MDNTTDNGDGTFGAANYDPLATCPDTLADGSSVCTYGIPGCTDALACNYDPLATADNGQCTYTVTGYDCAGVCLDDADGDGICDPFEVNGCTDALALNYSVLATDDDGSCILCSTADTVNFTTLNNMGSGSAQNFDAIPGWSGGTVGVGDEFTYVAVAGSGTNVTVIFTDGDTETNWDELYIFDENGTLLNTAPFNNVTGQTFTSAGSISIEFDTDGSVVRDLQWIVYCQAIQGCMDVNALNYNPDASIDNGSCTYLCDPYVGTLSSTDATCFGGSDGTATAVVPNAIGATTLSNTWLWSDGQTSTTAENLAAGTYTVTISDAGTGCSITESVVVSEPSAILANVAVTPSNAGMSTGSMISSPSGGTPGYTYVWTNVFNSSGSPGDTLSVTSSVGSLGVGPINLHLIDGADCTMDTIIMGEELTVLGCTDATAFNYNPVANTDDG